MSLIDCLVFKQQKRIGHPQKKDVIDKEIYRTPSYGSDIPSETYPSPVSHSETSRIYLIPLPLLLFLLILNKILVGLTQCGPGEKICVVVVVDNGTTWDAPIKVQGNIFYHFYVPFFETIL